ncbi:unnamed protein product [Phytophthora lilii]|uniref:Unnamed protein product n=1 Tax=Phytophthora lilii TaxID=2077276 RepID=A0A9W6TR50_9STRA|nr:unnamed protein product [Phytophthora lilii]
MIVSNNKDTKEHPNGASISRDTQGRNKSESSNSEDDETNQTQRMNAILKRRMYRQRQKDERENLQRQQLELGKELVRVKQVKESERARFISTRPPAYFFWKSTAARQQEECARAQMEQNQLNVAVAAQAAYIKTLTNILGKRFESAITSGDYDWGHEKRCVKVTEASLFDAYIQELKKNFTRADEILTTCGITEIHTTDGMRTSVHRRESNGVVDYFQQLNKTVLPFSLNKTGQLLWGFAEQLHSRNQDYKRCGNVSDHDMIVERYRETTALKTGMKIRLLQRYVLHKFHRQMTLSTPGSSFRRAKGYFAEFKWMRLAGADCCLP